VSHYKGKYWYLEHSACNKISSIIDLKPIFQSIKTLTPKSQPDRTNILS
jgi:hypothetical protein